MRRTACSRRQERRFLAQTRRSWRRGQNLLSKLLVEVIIGTGWYEMIANLHDQRTERGRGMGLLGMDESRPWPTARRAWAR
jgi:hypothetical protein